jgi:hypothetical protein
MTQQPRAEHHRVICLFCGTRTFVPEHRDILNPLDSGSGVALVRCHVCHKEAPYSASEIFLSQEATLCEGNARSRAAGL